MADGVSPISGVAPPTTGKWRPGQSGNPGGRPKKKPITGALQDIFNKLSPQEAQSWALEIFKKAGGGDVAAFKEIADRVEGRVAQPVGGSEELGPVQVTWKQSK